MVVSNHSITISLGHMLIATVDSLVAVEIRNWFIKELRADVSVFDILGAIPISTLAVKIAENSKLLAEKFGTGKKDQGVIIETDHAAADVPLSHVDLAGDEIPAKKDVLIEAKEVLIPETKEILL